MLNNNVNKRNMNNKILNFRFLIAVFLFFAFFGNGLLIQAQNIEFNKASFPGQKDQLKKALDDIKKGDEEFDLGGAGHYASALDNYLKAQAFNPNNALLNYKIGKSYLNTYQKTNSVPFLEAALKLNPYVNPDLHYLLGQAYHLSMDFDKADSEYKAYKQTLQPKDLSVIGLEVDKKIVECQTGKELISKPVRAFIDDLGCVVNSAYPDYSPIVNADESMMIFCSRRETSTGGDKDVQDGGFLEDIYMTYNTNGTWSSPINPGKPLNTDLHDAPVGLSADGQKLFVYKVDNGGDIYQCDLDGDKWSKPDRLSKAINTDYHESSASFSYDAKTIYFVSNKPGGYGGRDIWMSKLNEKGKWGDAINLGSGINTKYDEEGVFMLPDGKTMYFSSRGHKTMGGFDIFKTVFENGKWSEPENIGYPINTCDDDIFFTIAASGKHGYYSSGKIGDCGSLDIYCITFLGPEKQTISNNEDNLLASLTEPVSETVIEPVVAIKTTNLTILKGIVMDEKTSVPVKATIELTDNTKNEVIATFESNSKTGKYLVSLPSGKNYGIAVKSESYLFHSENFDIPSVAGYQEVNKDIKLKKFEVGTKIVLNNIFFDTGKSILRPESYAELGILLKLMNDMPTLKIEISGHTDNVGSAASNKTLSENRAKAVVDYLIGKGVGGDRMTFKGYGFDQPIATNATQEGRQMNRRTEFKVLSR